MELVRIFEEISTNKNMQKVHLKYTWASAALSRIPEAEEEVHSSRNEENEVSQAVSIMRCKTRVRRKKH